MLREAADIRPEKKLLERYVKQGHLPYLSQVFADELRALGLCEDQHIFALAYIYASSMKGHFCSIIEDDQLFPSLALLGSVEHEDHQLKKLIIEGSRHLPDALLLKESLSEIKPLARLGNAFYLHKDYVLETKIIQKLSARIQEQPFYSFDASKVLKTIEQEACNLNEEQKKAVLTSFIHAFTLITGGPGTGKTHTIGSLVNVYLELSRSYFLNTHISIMAPTGKACSRLKTALASTVDKYSGRIKISTIHSSLSLNTQQDYHREQFFIGSDLIIIDECSMIDMNMWYALLVAIQKGARVVLLGDPYQLPSVEKGGIFQNIVDIADRCHIPKVTLNQCLRSDKPNLKQLSQCILENRSQECLDLLRADHKELKFIEGNEISHLHRIKEDIKTLFKDPSFQQHQEEETLLHHLKKASLFKVLTPLKQGPLGTYALNQMFYEQQLNLVREVGWMAFPIMIKKNDLEKELFNGDTGYLMSYFDEEKKLSLKSQYGVFFSEQGEIRTLASSFLPAFEYAYALSVHKSQGSEFPHVLLLIPEGAETFGKEIFYTGVTRAKVSLKIYGNEHIITSLLQSSLKPTSLFKDRLAAELKLPSVSGSAY